MHFFNPLLLLASSTVMANNDDIFANLPDGLYTIDTTAKDIVPIPFNPSNHTRLNTTTIPRHPHSDLRARHKVPVGSHVDCFPTTHMWFDDYYEAELELHNICMTNYGFDPGHGIYSSYGSATAFFCNLGTKLTICDNYEFGLSIDEWETKCPRMTPGVVTVPAWGKRYGRLNAGAFAGCIGNSDTGTAKKETVQITDRN